MLELKDTRNSIDYRGITVSHELWKNNEMKIKLTINALREIFETVYVRGNAHQP